MSVQRRTRRSARQRSVHIEDRVVTFGRTESDGVRSATESAVGSDAARAERSRFMDQVLDRPCGSSRPISSEGSDFSLVRCCVSHVTSLLGPQPMWTTLAIACRVVFTSSVGGGRFDLRRRRNSKQLLQPSRDPGPFFIGGLLSRAMTALSDRCEQFS